MTQEDERTEENTSKSEEHEITFSYLKSQFFRVIHADGAWGGLSPRGDIHISFYNERMAIPDKGTLRLSEAGKVLKPEEFEATSKIVREIEVDVIVDIATARQLRTWLDDKIRMLQELMKAASEGQDKEALYDEKVAQ